MKRWKRGSSVTGYGLIVGLIAVLALVSIKDIGEQVDRLFGSVSDNLGNAENSVPDISDTPDQLLSIQSTSPMASATDVLVNIPVSFIFNQDIDFEVGLDAQSEIDFACGSNPIDFVPQISGSTLNLSPLSSFPIGETCTVSIPDSLVVSVSGEATFDGYTLVFTTFSGNAFSWGYNVRGQLGDGTTTNSSIPVPVSGELSFSQVSGGWGHNCGLSGGAAYCWGEGLDFELGVNNRANSSIPVEVSGGLSFSQLAPGDDHTCALSGGTVYCWGSNDRGARGIGETSRLETPTPTPVSGNLSFSQIVSGAEFSCGLSGGTAYCWGADFDGDLRGPEEILVPTAISVSTSFSEISAGSRHACGLSNGTTYCWGTNNRGQLGNGTVTSHENNIVPVSGGLSFSQLGLGATHTCGLSGGAAYCWGDNSYGQLGNGTLINSSSPVPVSGGLSFTQIVSGFGFTCGLSGGTVYCWGRNSSGQLGDGTNTNRLVPVTVTGDLNFTQISAGSTYMLGVQ